MGPLQSHILFPSAPPPPSPTTPTSPPSSSPPPLRHPRLPPPPPPLPPPPSFPPHLPLPSTSPPLPPPCRALRLPPRDVTAPGPVAAPSSGRIATAVLAFSSPSPRRCGRGGHSVEHVVHARGFPTTRPVCGDVCGEDLAGVPPEMLPPKKRLVRFHPYEAAWTIQEIAASVDCGGFGNRPAPLTMKGDGDGDAGGRGDEGCPDWDDDGLRAELLLLRISRPALVLTKRLTPSDRSRDKARLVLPDSQVRASPLLNMLTAGERHLVFSRERGGLPVPAFDRMGRSYRMALKRDCLTRRSHTYRLTGQWSLFLSRHGVRDGDAVEVLAFRPSAWQARLDRCGEGGLGMALLLHRRDAGAATAVDAREHWSNRETDAADGLLLLAGDSAPGARLPPDDGGGDLRITLLSQQELTDQVPDPER